MHDRVATPSTRGNDRNFNERKRYAAIRRHRSSADAPTLRARFFLRSFFFSSFRALSASFRSIRRFLSFCSLFRCIARNVSRASPRGILRSDCFVSLIRCFALCVASLFAFFEILSFSSRMPPHLCQSAAILPSFLWRIASFLSPSPLLGPTPLFFHSPPLAPFSVAPRVTRRWPMLCVVVAAVTAVPSPLRKILAHSPAPLIAAVRSPAALRQTPRQMKRRRVFLRCFAAMRAAVATARQTLTQSNEMIAIAA